ncbi:4-hydroxy-3-methylbut-2-enyl diphosphate reductase [Actinomadura mexicana]|uniref:4-hydroxy-3-methylbut-2-enyl diphosphate reductase n=1 Tax=Actinomadura mexicana TaxID=134959 RepID=A0A238XKN7_9ACTN|nr:4-hydroxy-3-methylbut-2-enyl diphosphate reductase [Actinomadura mexicana]SNR59586.1 4-hydroxy-3-methylbut-2-enyl diphosphate reductase [Actinomadura mexicana]
MSAGGKRVLLASPRGFCAGVERAVAAVEKALELYGAPVYVRHEIVHNAHVVRDLEAKGAVFVDEAAQAPEGAILMYSAHGVAPTVRAEARARGLRTIDATCPLVTKVHKEAHRYAAEDYHILLIGHEGHEEVIGTMGHAPGRVTLVDGPEHAAGVTVPGRERLAWLSQTTLSVDETTATVEVLADRFPQLQGPPSADICYATQNRQEAVKRIAAEADLVLIVGSANSSNSRRLAEVASDAGARRAHLVEDATQVDTAWLEDAEVIGLSSGASAPDALVREILALLAARGWDRVEPVRTANESITFALPRELGAEPAGDRDRPPGEGTARRADTAKRTGRA